MKQSLYAVVIALAGVLLAPGVSAEERSVSGEGCYGYLTELVRSSNFPFRYVTRDKVNLLIDEDDGEQIRLKLFFDTDGTGTIGWAVYTPATRELVDISADPEAPVVLKYDSKFAQQYAKCLTGKRAS
ncbi:hypothetical protein [Pseudomonas purpurea]|uniref:hypothetical protein n=1 Tax=Pseudomonas purpurea TaxID=3136737 RepID=UPI00326554E5